MMRRYTWLVFVCLASWGLAACVPAAVPMPSATSTPTTTYEAVPLKGDPHVAFNAITKKLLIDVTSSTGIGSARIEKTSGLWPPYIVTHLKLTGLENFKFRYADIILDVTVSSQGDHAVSETYQQAGQTNTIHLGDPHWISVTPGEGYFDLQAPIDFLKSGEISFTIEWIDFYR